MELNRRSFIKIAGMAGMVLVAPGALASTPRRGRVVVFLELNGGNDGLNTVVPLRDPLYQKLRPNLALTDEQLRGLDDDTALHPSLSNTAQIWEAGELGIVEGVGYANPNRSHFRSIEIWETGSSADEYASRGWLSRVAPGEELDSFTPAALNVGGGGDGPLAGANSLDLDDPKRLFRMTRGLKRHEVPVSNPALAHVLGTQNEMLDAVATLRKHAADAPSFDGLFKGNRQLRPMQLAAELVASGLPLLAVKIRIPGFDTHVNQKNTHARLLQVVDEGVGAFRRAMKSAGMWDDVVIVTYSEFGRRPRENGGGGTDHGTAAPHFVMGGSVKGGRYGKRPSLQDLDGNGDLRFTTDYRSMYRALAEDWWGFDGAALGSFDKIPLLG